MNYRIFGLLALAGLGSVWLFGGKTQAASAGPRNLIASFYGYECAGKLMANGKPFDPQAFTCASWDYPLGTKLLVSNKSYSVLVTVTDRGPARRLLRTRQIDLSRAAFSALSPIEAGLIEVTVQRL